MANKYSNHLFELIKSLSKAEKRYFNLFVSRHSASNSPNNAQLLFDAIDKQDNYKEEEILEKLKDYPLINKFSITKARLYDTILKSLDAYYAEKSKSQLIRNEIHYIEILFNKSLYKQCAKRINSAKKQAIKYNKNHLLSQLILWEKKLIEKDNYQSIERKKIESLSHTEQNILTDIVLKSQLWEFKALLFQQLNKIGRARSLDEVQTLKSNVEEKLKLIDIPPEKIGLSYLFNHILCAYYFAIYEEGKSLQSVLTTIQIIEKNTVEFLDEPNILISELTNGVYLAMKQKEIKKAQELYDKLKILYNKSREEGSNDLVLKIKSSLMSLELLLVTQTCDFKKFDSIFPAISIFIEENKNILNDSRLAFLYYNIAHNLFIQDEFNDALKWINKLLNSINIDQAQEIYSSAEILNLFIHYELKNYELINYSLKSTKRFLKTRNKLFDYESTVLNFMQKVSNYKFDPFEIDNLLTQLLTELKEITNNPFENIPFEYFDIKNWTNSKLNNQKLSVITREQNSLFLKFKF